MAVLCMVSYSRNGQRSSESGCILVGTLLTFNMSEILASYFSLENIHPSSFSCFSSVSSEMWSSTLN